MHELCIPKESYSTNKGNQGKLHQDSPFPKTTPQRAKRKTKWPSSWTQTLSPILIPGTPDSFIATESPPTNENEKEGYDSEDSVALFYQAYSKHKPKIDESNADSVARTALINQEIERLKHLRKQKKRQQQARQNEGFATPEKQIKHTITNNTQSIDLTSDEAIPLSNKPQCIEPIEVIMDTGAALTMFPGTYRFAWRNLRPCLYALSECFNGDAHSDLEVGEFHGIMTLDKGEPIRLIIPEAVKLLANISNSTLLANTPFFLMAGHKYVNDLYSLTLKFKQGGKYALTVKQGHHIFTILPTTHRIIYAHNDEPYDPPHVPQAYGLPEFE
jgi:hypothetical protein